MDMALDLAQMGVGYTSPNPVVGAVVVNDGEVVGRGFHRRAGEPHAEVIALEEAGERAKGATLYVTLEPCCHWGRTGPCAERVVSSGISRVVVAMVDPYPKVAGGGIALLRQSGVEVSVGLGKERAARLNEPFIKFILTGRPLVVLKWAMTLDGRIASRLGVSKWITSMPAREEVHRMRARYEAVLVGRTTVERDDPELTVRHCEGRDPLRVILDSHGRVPPGARCLPGAVVATAGVPPERARELERRGAEVLHLPPEDGRVAWNPLLEVLAGRGITSILVEGGSEVAASALKARVVDKVAAFVAPRVLGGASALGPVGGEGAIDPGEATQLVIAAADALGGDLLIEAYVKGSAIYGYYEGEGISVVHRHCGRDGKGI
jgi:diaminohydroxyphosphoribosylaminopyrimidine deaminase/5-amino-6-(5-phosphoribosylamino)uracil reductase